MTNVWYVKNIFANCDGNVYLPKMQVLSLAEAIKQNLAFQAKALRLESPSLLVTTSREEAFIRSPEKYSIVYLKVYVEREVCLRTLLYFFF